MNTDRLEQIREDMSRARELCGPGPETDVEWLLGEHERLTALVADAEKLIRKARNQGDLYWGDGEAWLVDAEKAGKTE